MDCGLVSSPSIPSNVVIIPTDAGCGIHLTPLLILTMKTAPFWILASAAALTVDPTKLSGIGDGNHTCHLPRVGEWNKGGYCDNETEPDKNPTGIETEPYNNIVISEVVRQRMDYGKWKVQFLNITNLSEIRRDGHPSRYREEGTPPGAPQDCSHWCLPGVPDTWNELPYAHLISKQFGINTRI